MENVCKGEAPRRNLFKEEVPRVLIVLFCATVYSLAVMWFLNPVGLYAAGITGLAQIITRILDKFADIQIPSGILVFIFNVPLFIYGWKKVSKRFSIYSLLFVIVQSVLMLDWLPVEDFGITDPSSNALLYAIIGGLIAGAANGVALRFGTSTGGIDILGQVLSIEKGISIGMFTMMFNVLIAVLGGGVLFGNWLISMFTLIRIIISSLVIDRIHTAYNYVRLDIISANVKDIAERLMKELGRGVTLMNVEGAYTHQQKQDAFMIITSYEVARAKRICLEVDPTVFIVIAPAKGTVGRFIKKTIM